MRAYLQITGALFGLIAVVHVLRLIRHWPIQLAEHSIPLWASWVGLIVAGALSIWAARLLRVTGPAAPSA